MQQHPKAQYFLDENTYRRSLAQQVDLSDEGHDDNDSNSNGDSDELKKSMPMLRVWVDSCNLQKGRRIVETAATASLSATTTTPTPKNGSSTLESSHKKRKAALATGSPAGVKREHGLVTDSPTKRRFTTTQHRMAFAPHNSETP